MGIDRETRSLRGELRAASTAAYKIEGIAARYNSRSSNLGGFVEQIAPGAFTRSLNAGAKVVLTTEHNPNFLLGSTRAGTLVLQDSKEGLRFSCQLDSTNSQHRDVYASIKRGDLDSCSFIMRIPDGGESWVNGGAVDERGNTVALRTITDADLLEVSAVTFPAYPNGTSVDARAAAHVLGAQTDAALRDRAEILGLRIRAANLGRIIEEGNTR